MWVPGEVPARIRRVDVKTGVSTRWKELAPADRTGVQEILRVVLSDDGSAYAYSYTRELSALHLLEGLK